MPQHKWAEIVKKWALCICVHVCVIKKPRPVLLIDVHVRFLCVASTNCPS
ncbi:unnamed protein product [Taenia asiatica]|uniref:Uncharacterized protein n=1 Tax=Taenia asiatica TaxID=60517 RepID=A0A0R3W518_TAEAS|nr:unnamed protein product [Taenia asiatica]